MRLDHLVVAVRDLDAAVNACRALGFEVEMGGRHPGFGSRNAIIRFGLDYIELLTVDDEATARTAAPGSLALVEYLKQHEWGLLGFMVAGTGLENCRRRLIAQGIETPPPWSMSRVRPDGHELAWKLLQPGGLSWRRPWPTVIEWITPSEDRLAWDGARCHPNGAIALSCIRLGAQDFESPITIYQRGFGLALEEEQAAAELNARRINVVLERGFVEILVPDSTNKGPIARMLQNQGEGIFCATIEIQDIERTSRWLSDHGHQVSPGSAKSICLRTPGLLDGLEFTETSSPSDLAKTD